MTSSHPGHGSAGRPSHGSGGQPSRGQRPHSGSQGQGGDAEAYWRRPPEGAEPARASPPDEATPEPVYPGPPRSAPPPSGWRTPTVVEPLPARTLPEQDIAAIEAEEREAQTFTYGVALLAGAVMIIILVLVCARLVS